MWYNKIMINSIKNTSVYKSLFSNKERFHSYLFFSADKELNNNVALCFAKQIVCENETNCGVCSSCKQFDSLSHPDVHIVDQQSVKVEDINIAISKINTMPINSKYKVFVFLNAENINEIAQNKLLKSIEEPTSHSIFIFTTTKTDKLLPTILSRVNKNFVQNLNNEDKIMLAKSLKEQGIDIFKYIETDFNLTEMLNYSTNSNFANTINTISTMLTSLKTSQDIPKVVSNIKEFDKTLFLPLLQEVFLSSLNNTNKFDKALVAYIKLNYSEKAISKCVNLINEAYKKQMANVNFTYILDNLLFNMLKEKFLCK